MPLAKAMMEAAGNSTQPVYIEDVMSTYLYTGNGSTQTINNGIDLAGKGGLVWIKNRGSAVNHAIGDTDILGFGTYLSSNTTAAAAVDNNTFQTFNSNGFTIKQSTLTGASANNYVSWTFRKQPKFFDVVTYTGNGANRTIAHNLQSVPGCIIVKRTDSTGDWRVYHIAEQPNKYFSLNLTSGDLADTTMWNNTAPTSSVFSLGTNTSVNASGGTYVAYLFAHNAGGFGLTGTDSVISCGYYVGNGSTNGTIVNLGWEPQWLLIKQTSASGTDWNLIDNMRGFVVGGTDAELNPNLSNAESTGTFVSPTSTGFQLNTTDSGYNGSGVGYLYIAIRRGPMKTPTSGTSVFDVQFEGNVPDGKAPFTRSSTGVVDMGIRAYRPGLSGWPNTQSRLAGTEFLVTSSNAAATTGITNSFDFSNGWLPSPATSTQTSQVDYIFRRAPGFFDEVCYTGNGAASRAVPHNLTVAPELIIVKARNLTQNWFVYNGAKPTFYLTLDTTNSESNSFNIWGGTATATNFYVNNVGSSVNDSGYNFVAYLFASCPGVSKVGSYTGTGTTLQINCGFTSGARFVLIKRTDSTGDWYVWDTARGIVSGNDPYLLLNSTAAEVTSTDYIDTYSAGFEISSTAPAAINASGGTFIYLAIA